MGCFFMLSCENDLKDVERLSKDRLGIEEITGVETIYTTGGNLRAILHSPLMLRYQLDTPKMEFPKTLHVVFYDSLKRFESDLFAKYGRYMENENRVYLRDSVVVFNVKKDTLKTNELWWDQQKALFYSNKPVTIIQQDKTIYGDGMVSNEDFSNMTITNPKGLVSVPDTL